MRGRQVLHNVLEAQVAMEEATMLGMGPRALAFCGIVAAFPSAQWDWIWGCLSHMGIPQWVRDGMRVTYGQTMVVFNGEVYQDMIVNLRRGIMQGCPASGALWALLFDPIVRRQANARPHPGHCLTCLADDVWQRRWATQRSGCARSSRFFSRDGSGGMARRSCRQNEAAELLRRRIGLPVEAVPC